MVPQWAAILYLTLPAPRLKCSFLCPGVTDGTSAHAKGQQQVTCHQGSFRDLETVSIWNSWNWSWWHFKAPMSQLTGTKWCWGGRDSRSGESYGSRHNGSWWQTRALGPGSTASRNMGDGLCHSAEPRVNDPSFLPAIYPIPKPSFPWPSLKYSGPG